MVKPWVEIAFWAVTEVAKAARTAGRAKRETNMVNDWLSERGTRTTLRKEQRTCDGEKRGRHSAAGERWPQAQARVWPDQTTPRCAHVSRHVAR